MEKLINDLKEYIINNQNNLSKEELLDLLNKYNLSNSQKNDLLELIENNTISNNEFTNYLNENTCNTALQNIYYEQIRNIIFGKSESNLTEKEKDILKLRFGFNGDPQTYYDISKKYNVSPERIRQIELIAIRKLKHNQKTTKLFNY